MRSTSAGLLEGCMPSANSSRYSSYLVLFHGYLFEVFSCRELRDVVSSSSGLFVVILLVIRFCPPRDQSRPEARQGQNRAHITAVGAHLVQSGLAMILKPEHDPAAVRRVRPNRRLHVASFVMRQKTQVSSVRPDGCNVCRNSRWMANAILREYQMPPVRRPVLLDGNTEDEWR